MRALMICLLIAASGCASRSESMVYAPDEIPRWILEEWSNAQQELLRLPDIPDDPRRYHAQSWHWVQLDREFVHAGGSEWLRGATIFPSKEIIVCCGYRETVRHEAFHAILRLMGDKRYAIHYPDLRKELE